MSKTLVYIVTVISVVAVSVGSYYVVTHSAAPSDTPTSTSPPVNGGYVGSNPAPKPNHGDFQKRFEPKPPPAKSSKP
jgi:hypothetical protein